VCVQRSGAMRSDASVLPCDSMVRQPKEDRAGIATETLTLRFTLEDRTLLARLVALRAAELSDEGLEVTAASYVRGLIRRDAKAKGILEETAAPPMVEWISPSPEAPGASQAAPPSVDEVLVALLRAIRGGTSQAELARQAGLNGGHLSRFKTNKTGLSPEALRKLASVLKLIP
jgi:hypothetical protein